MGPVPDPSDQAQHVTEHSQFFLDRARTGVLFYYGTAIVVLLGMVLGHKYLKSTRPRDADLLKAFGNWDGEWYRGIVENSYAYDSHKPSNVAFFPGYPVLGRGVVWLSNGDTNLALLLVAHVCLA